MTPETTKTEIKIVEPDKLQNPITVSGVDALVDLFIGAGSTLEINPEEINWILEKVKYYSCWAKSLLQHKLIPHTSPLLGLTQATSETTDAFRRDCSERVLTCDEILEKWGPLGGGILHDGSSPNGVASLLTLLLAYNDRFVVTVSITTLNWSGESVVVEIKPRTSAPKKVIQKEYHAKLDSVTQEGAKLLEEDIEKDAKDKPVTIIDHYIEKLSRSNPAAFENINSTKSRLNAIGIFMYNKLDGMDIESFGMNLGAISKYLDVDSNEFNHIKDSKRSKIQVAKTHNAIIRKYSNAITPQVVLQGLKHRVVRLRRLLGSIFTTAPTSVQPSLLTHDLTSSLASGYKDISVRDEVILPCIDKHNFAVNVKPTAGFESNVRKLNDNTLVRLMSQVMRKTKKEQLVTLGKCLLDTSTAGVPKLSPKIDIIYKRLSLSDSPDKNTVRLFQIGRVHEIQLDNEMTYRVAVLRSLNDQTNNIVLSAIETSGYYNFIDENRYVAATFSRDFAVGRYDSSSYPLSNLLLLDNLENFIKQTQQVLTSTGAGEELAGFMHRNDVVRGKSSILPPVIVDFLPYSFRSGRTAYGSSDNRTSLNSQSLLYALKNNHRSAMIVDLFLCSKLSGDPGRDNLSTKNYPIVNLSETINVSPFVAIDAAQVNFHANRGRRGYRGGAARGGPINYGNTVADIQDKLSQRAVRAFWKGMEKISTTGKSFKIAPYGGNEEVEFYPDRIVFQDQVLKSNNLLVTPPKSLLGFIGKMNDDTCSDPLYGSPGFTEEELKKEEEKYQRAVKTDRPRVLANIENERAKRKKTIKFREKFSYNNMTAMVKKYVPSYCDEMSTDVPRSLAFMFWDRANLKGRNLTANASWCQGALLISKEHYYLRRAGWNETFPIDEVSSAILSYNNLDLDSGRLGHSDDITGPDDLDFNVITQKFVDCVCAPFALSKKTHDIFSAYVADRLPTGIETEVVCATIGAVECKVSIDVTLSKDDKRVKKWKVNGYKVRRDEINPIMKRAMCFQEQEAYDDFISAVSKVSLRARDLMANGLAITVCPTSQKYTYQKNGVPVLLEFTREGKQWQLITRNPGGSIYKIHSIGGGVTKFVTMSANQARDIRLGNSQEKYVDGLKFIKMMENVKNFGTESIQRLFSTGLRVVNERLARSRKLLEETVEMVKSQYITHTYGSKTLSGYKITGISGRSYLVCCDKASGKKGTHNDHGDDKFGAVYSLPNLAYVCIVDKSHDQTGYDIIVNRLLALKNDKFIAGSVTTLNQYIGS